jgi:hypothetical protein
MMSAIVLEQPANEIANAEAPAPAIRLSNLDVENGFIIKPNGSGGIRLGHQEYHVRAVRAGVNPPIGAGRGDAER